MFFKNDESDANFAFGGLQRYAILPFVPIRYIGVREDAGAGANARTLTMSGICIWYRSILSTPRRLRDYSHASTTLSVVFLQGDGVNFVATATRDRGADKDEDNGEGGEEDVLSRRSLAIRRSVSPWAVPRMDEQVRTNERTTR